MAVRLREATPADVDRLCEVNSAAIETLGSEPYDERQIAAWKSGVDPELYPIEAAETRFLVAETDERVVGFGWMKPEADDYFTIDVDGEITGMYVHPNAARNGVGTRLLGALERAARELRSLAIAAVSRESLRDSRLFRERFARSGSRRQARTRRRKRFIGSRCGRSRPAGAAGWTRP